MAPISTRQLFVLNLPAIAILLSYFWYRRKRIGAPSDPGDKETAVETDVFIDNKESFTVPVDIEPRFPYRTSSSVEDSPCAVRPITEDLNNVENTPYKSFSRSFSAPIPIILPRERRLSKTLNISDEELDQQIEKLKSVKRADPFSLISQGRTANSCSISPIYFKDLSETRLVEDKLLELDNNNLEKIASSKEGIVEETEEAVSPCEEVVEEICSTSIQDTEEAVTAIEEENLSDNNQEVTTSEDITEEGDTSTNCDILRQIDSTCDEMTSTNDKKIVQKSDSSCVDKTEEMAASVDNDVVVVEETVAVCIPEGSNQTASSASDDIVASADSPCLDQTKEMSSSIDEDQVVEVTVSSASEDLIASADSPCPDQTKEMTSSVEEDQVVEQTVSECTQEMSPQAGEDVAASSADNSVSADDLDTTLVSTQEPSPCTSSAGVIPKQSKKKKFRKLECDLKDLGKKLKESHITHAPKGPRRRRRGQKSRNDSGCEREEIHCQSSGRESVMVSPSDTMMAACGSLDSLNSSEGSNDSGKGCSDTNTPPPPPHTFYEFLIPVEKVGKLIGKRGCFVTRVYTETNAHLVVRDHPSDKKVKICIVEGTERAIHKAMGIVKQRFPREKLEPFLANYVAAYAGMLNRANLMQVPLPPVLNAESFVTTVVTPNHIFIHLPLNPTFHNFLKMHYEMQKLYMSEEVPLIPKPVQENVLCVALTINGWSRVTILSADQNGQMTFVRDMDFGGYYYVPFEHLKQIRGDFFTTSFQAIECILANIEPIDGVWTEESFEFIRKLTEGFGVFTHIVDFTPDNTYVVNCQVVTEDKQVLWVNERLVTHGYAKWTNQKQECVNEKAQ